MAVQKSRVTRSKRGMRRSHDGLANPALSLDATTGEAHLRHRLTPDGYYRGRQVVKPKAPSAKQLEEAEQQLQSSEEN